MTWSLLGGLLGLLAQASTGEAGALLVAAGGAWAVAGRLQRRAGRLVPLVLAGTGAWVYFAARLVITHPLHALWFEGSILVLDALMAGSLALAVTPFLGLIASMREHHYPAHLERWQTASALLVLVLVLAGLAGLLPSPRVPFIEPALVALAFVVLALAASSGVGSSTTVSVALALPLAAISGNWPLLTCAGVAGLLAGLFPLPGKPGALIGWWLGVLIMAAWPSGNGLPPGDVQPVAQATQAWGVGVRQLLSFSLGSLLFILVPPGWLEWLRRLVCGVSEPDWNHMTLSYLRQQITARLAGVASVLGQVAQAFDRLPVAAAGSYGSPRYPDQELGPAEAFLADVRGQACQGCTLEKKCWQQLFPSTYWSFMELLAREHPSSSASLRPEDVPIPLRERCVRLHRLALSVTRARELARVEAAWRQRVVESRQLVGGELRGLSQLMEVLAREMMLDVRLNTGLAARLEAELVARQFPPAQVTVLEAGERQREIEVELKLPAAADPSGWGERLARVVMSAVQVPQAVQWREVAGDTVQSGVQVAPYSRPRLRRGSSHRRILYHLEPAPAWQLEVGVSSQTKPGSVISGDSVLRFPLGSGREVLILSDGMGAGWPAADESQAAVLMLRRLLEAGFRTDFAVRTVNAALLLRSSDQEKFATLDLLTVDLQVGQAELIKIGSPPSALYSKGKVRWLSTSSLPAGILAGIQIDPQVVPLGAGDVLVLMTDGVADGVEGTRRSRESLVTELPQLVAGDPSEGARRLLQAALVGSGDRPADDATVVTIRLTPAERKVPVEETEETPPLAEYLRLIGSLLPSLDENPTRV
ncbi:MAG: SpoIIE family protein phosphatase [Limnochordaceae bacterium]|nr:SpoIIE family protein phosphatase [Limnochordaceae bacterium]